MTRNHVTLLSTALLSLVALSAQAAPRTFSAVPGANRNSGVSFSLDYTGGVHQGTVAAVSGTAVMQPEASFQIASARFVVAIQDLSTANVKRDCHMREALGLDYSTSIFPTQHVCGATNTLPTTGPNAIAFPNAIFTLDSIENVAATEGVQSFTANGTFEIHGVKQSVKVPMVLTLAQNGSKQLTITGDFSIKLADYGITVMPFLFITVADTAQVKLNLTMQEN